MSRLYVRKSEVGSNFASARGRADVFEFEAQMSSESRRFPVYSALPLPSDQLRYLFLDQLDAEALGEQLAQFVAESRFVRAEHSLVVFTRPGPVQTIDAYHKKFWLLLDHWRRSTELVACGHPRTDRPSDVGVFVAGEPIFVVCSTPAHVIGKAAAQVP